MSLFVYGTLTNDTVLARVVGRPVATTPATLPAHRRHAVCDAPYPAAVPDATASIHGLLALGLTAAELARLDAFEGLEYTRQPVSVHTPAGTVPAAAYLWIDTPARLAGDWDDAWLQNPDAVRLWVQRELALTHS